MKPCFKKYYLDWDGDIKVAKSTLYLLQIHYRNI